MGTKVPGKQNAVKKRAGTLTRGKDQGRDRRPGGNKKEYKYKSRKKNAKKVSSGGKNKDFPV